jgi:PAS domain S-box-containing protein
MSTLGSSGTILEYSRAIDALPIVAWISDADGNLAHLSQAWERFTGRTVAETTEQGYETAVHPSDLPRVVLAWDAARAAAGRYSDEFRILLADGSYRWVVSQGNPIFDASGKPLGWLGTITDIHDRRLAEEALAERNSLLQASEERHRLIGHSLPGTTWTATPDGKLDHVSNGPLENTYGPADAALGDAWLDFVHDDDRERVRELWKRSVESGAPYDATYRVRIADGSYRWFLVRALPQRGASNEIARWVGVIVDVDDSMRADAEREKFVALAEQSGDIIWITDLAGAIVYANPATLASLEATRYEMGRAHFLDCFHEDDVAFARSDILPAMEREGRWVGECRLRNFRSGRAIPTLYSTFALRDPSGAATGFATISRDMAERQRIELGMAALADAGKVMLGSLDFQVTMQNIADAVASRFATGCSVEVVGSDGAIETITLATRDPAGAAVARAAAVVRNRSLPADHPIWRAIHRGESTLIAPLPRAFLESTGLHKYIGDGAGQLDLRSIIYVPIRSPRDGTIHGSLSCGLSGDDPRGLYQPQDVRFAEEIAVRAALAFDNAFAYERTRHIASELQAASLPASLPASPDLLLDAEYRPATEEAAIGGDWYDAFALPDGRIVVTVGDVVGHGLQAAIWMSKLRQSMQSAAMLSDDPGVLLTVANRTLRLLGADVFATAMAAIYDPASGSLTIASAGHPGPTIRRRDGTIEEHEYPGLILGLPIDEEYRLHQIALGEGDIVVFYTDGLLEVDRNADRGRELLRNALGIEDVREADHMATAIVERVLGGAVMRDDIAVLTARVL